MGSDTTQTLDVSGNNVATITGLTSSTEYFVQVAAVNSAGTGPYSDAITTETQESLSNSSINL